MVTRLGIINCKTWARKRPWPNLRHPFRGTEENKSVAGTSQKQISTLSYSVAMIERVNLWKPILNMQNQMFMRPQLRLSSVGRHGSAGIMTRLRMDSRGIVAMTGYVSLLQGAHNDSAAHPDSYLVRPSRSIPGIRLRACSSRNHLRLVPSIRMNRDLIPLPLPTHAWREQGHVCFSSLSKKVYFHTLQVAV
jgi:hypothetical protein